MYNHIISIGEITEFVKARLMGKPTCNKYVVLTSKMPIHGTWARGPQYKIAVVSTNRLVMPKRIDLRSKAVLEIVNIETGVTESFLHHVLKHKQDLAYQLNKEYDEKVAQLGITL